MTRQAEITRKTKETDITVRLTIEGAGASKISTGIGFFDHMLDQLARHSLMDIEIAAAGDLHIDQHHTVEDVGIALGQALRKALGDLRGIVRYADVQLPMDETLTRVAVDISGRPFLVFRTQFSQRKDRRVRHRTGEGVFPGFRPERGNRPSYRNALRLK